MRRIIISMAAALLLSNAGQADGQSDPAFNERLKEIFVLAKNSVDEDDNVNFCGFFVGMSRHDASVLAKYYRLKEGESSFLTIGETAVWRMEFSLKGVRRVTKGGNTFDELVQAVANRVGDMKFSRDKECWEHKTIDGIVVQMSESRGLTVQNEGLKKKKPMETKAAAEAAEAAVKSIVPDILASMVQIPGKDYKMAKYEVTQTLWAYVMGTDPSNFAGYRNPVEKVSWDDCQEFLKKLNAMPEVKASGLVFRLPTAEEWEHACRAGATGKYCKLADGTEMAEGTLGDVAWYEDNSGNKTHPVGQKKPNAYGLYDMHGNVCEWTQTADGVYRFTCGGGWNDSDWLCGSSRRCRYSPSDRDNCLGFRLCASGRAD